MKIYKNPWVSRESYFIKTGAARSAKMEAAKSTGYSVDFWDGKWKVRKATYYNKSLDEMPVVCENKVSIQAVIGKAVLDAVRGFAGGGKSDGEETPQAGWLPVYESEITGWDPALAGRDPIGGYACSKCGYEAVYSCNDDGSCKFSTIVGDGADEQIALLEEWAAAHPRKTRQDVFLEQWPEAMIESDGVIAICPTALDKSYGKTHCTHILTKEGCDSCRSKFWGERGEPGGAYQLICEVPAADVEQVTRCKDCFQSVVIGAVLHCTYWCKDTDENGYCHEGG